MLHEAIPKCASWLGLHVGSVNPFFTNPDRFTKEYCDELARNAEEKGAKQYRLLIIDAKILKDLPKYIPAYQSMSRGVTTFWIDATNFEREYGKLAGIMHDRALFDKSIVLQFNRNASVMDILFDDEQFQYMQQLMGAVERRHENGDNRMLFRTLDELDTSPHSRAANA